MPLRYLPVARRAEDSAVVKFGGATGRMPADMMSVIWLVAKITTATLTLFVGGYEKLPRLARREATARINRTSHGQSPGFHRLRTWVSRNGPDTSCLPCQQLPDALGRR